ncbi:MAG TPA: SLC13 family permease, partial [Candidatus Acidoferrum sp.]|nr:SLC13 family permease [Candidatus Acidoferrum sp.]
MPDIDIETLITTLRSLPLFAELPREDLARLVGGLEEVAVPAGGIVYAQGEPGDAMYIVASGALEVRFGEEGWEERVRATGPGEWFGEMALLTGDPRSATVVALSDSRLWRLDKIRFLALSDQHPALLREITRVLCRRLATSAGKVGRARHAYAQAFEAVFAACSAGERQILFRAALAARPDPAILEALPGCASACALLGAFGKRHPALLRHGEGETCVLHPQFREYVLERLQREEEPEAVFRLHRDLAEVYEKRGEWREAVAHRKGVQDWSEAVRLIRGALAAPEPPAETDLGRLFDRLPESLVLTEPDLLRAKTALSARLGEGEAAVALYQRALAVAPAGGTVREVLLRDLADQYVAQGKVEQALACLREGTGGEGGEAGESAHLQEAVAARYLAAGRGAEAYALARSARALSRGLRETMASHLRRLWLVQGWHGFGLSLAAGGLVLAFPPAGLSPQAARLVATLAAAAVLWVGGQPPDFVVALGMGLAWVLLGVAPARTAFGGFASSAWFLILGIFAVGAALGRSGLLYRVTLLILRRCPPTFGGQVLALGLAGVASTLLVPSVQGRVALVGPMLVGVSEGLGYPPRSRGSAGLAFAALLGFGLATTLFLTGTATVLMAWGMLPRATRLQMTWGHWLLGVLPLELLIFFGTIGWIVWRYRPAEEARPARPGLVDAQLAALGPVTREQRMTAVVTAGMLVGWLTQGLHGVD